MKKNIKNIIGISLGVVMLASPIHAATFSDLNNGYGWVEKYVTDVSSKGIISGYPDGTYKPGVAVTRIETLVMIANLYPKSDIDTIYKNNSAKYLDKMNSFKIDEWARPYVVFALEKGIIPNNDTMLGALIETSSRRHITALRYEAAVFLVRGLELTGELNQSATLSYKDANQITSQAVPFIELLQRKGILSKEGDGTGNFKPNNSITRAEMAVMLSNAYKYSAKAKGDSTIPQTISQESIQGKIDLLTFADDNVTVSITTDDNKARNFVVNKKNLSVTLGSAIVSVNDIKVGQQGQFILTNGQLVKIALEEDTLRYSGVLADYSEEDKTLTVKIKDEGNKIFKYTQDSKIYLNDKLSSVNELPKDVDIDVYAKGNIVDRASAVFTKNEISGEVVEYSSDTITIKTDNGNVRKSLSNDIKIYRNEKRVDSINNIAIGDVAKITTDNDKVIEISIDAKSQKFLSAVIRSIEMNSYYNKIVIGDTSGNEHVLTIANDTVIRINSEKTNIYSLKIGYEADIYARGGLVEEIISKGEFRHTTVSGKVTSVDTIDKFIEIRQDNGSIIKIYYDNSTKIEQMDGRYIEARSVYEGDNVVGGIGILSGGNISATRIIIERQ